LEFSDLEAVGPGTPAGRYMRRFWLPVFRARDLKEGQAKPLEILGEKFTIYRGQDGLPHVVSFRCPHRGTQLSLGWVENDTLRCRYHGWRYDATGQCLEQPNEDRPFCEKVKMPVYPTRDYVGLIFVYLGAGEPPPFRHYPDFDRPGVIVADPPEILPCTFWNRLDNDNSHIPWVHRATAIRKGWNHYLVLRREGVEETEYGWKATRFPGKGEAKGALGLRGTAHFFMPNAFQFFQRTRAIGYEDKNIWDTKITWTMPVNDHAYIGFDVTHTPIEGEEGRLYVQTRQQQQEAEAETRWDLAEKVLAGEMTLEELPADMGANTSFTIEDYVTQVSQGSIAERTPENLGRSDVKPILLRRIWLREISAMLEGKTMTQWKIPDSPLRGRE
jgi:5,5'-dehydrodivanillate O-demethylase